MNKPSGFALNTSASDRSLARAGLAGLFVIVAAVFLSTPGQSAWLPPCPIFKFTGLYCPGCGTTRMLFYLVHGHPWEAVRYNALSLLVLPVVLYALVRASFDLRLPALPEPPARWLAVFALAVILFTVARNIPAEPFCKLAPGAVCQDRSLKTLSSPPLLRNSHNLHIKLHLSTQTFLDKGYVQPASI